MKTEMFHILNERTRRTREWQKFREDEKSRNYFRKRNSSDDHGKLQTPDVEEHIGQRDGAEPEQPLDGDLKW
jgi:hypothetical protein